MKEINEKLASIAWAMSNAAKDIESSTNLLRKLTTGPAADHRS